MAFARTALSAFDLANAAYIGATVAFYTHSGGVRTTTLATLYDATTGSGTLSNPQTLDDEGKFSVSAYVDVEVIGVITGSNAEDHETGVIRPSLSDDDVTAAAASATAAASSATAAATAQAGAETAETAAEAAQAAAEAAVGAAKVSADDTTAGVLDGKLTAGDGITFTVNNGGGNEDLEISTDFQAPSITTDRGIVTWQGTDGTGAYAGSFWLVTAGGGLTPGSDASYDIGTSSMRPRDIHLARSAYLPVYSLGTIATLQALTLSMGLHIDATLASDATVTLPNASTGQKIPLSLRVTVAASSSGGYTLTFQDSGASAVQVGSSFPNMSSVTAGVAVCVDFDIFSDYAVAYSAGALSDQT